MGFMSVCTQVGTREVALVLEVSLYKKGLISKFQPKYGLCRLLAEIPCVPCACRRYVSKLELI